MKDIRLRLLGLQDSRLSFPATEPPDRRRVPEGFQKGSVKGSLKGFRRVVEGFWKAFRRGQPRTLLKPFETPSETPSETPFETLLKPFWGPGSVAGNESLDARPRLGLLGLPTPDLELSEVTKSNIRFSAPRIADSGFAGNLKRDNPSRAEKVGAPGPFEGV